MSSVNHHRTPQNIRCILHNQHLLQMCIRIKTRNTSHWVEFTAPQGERGEKGATGTAGSAGKKAKKVTKEIEAIRAIKAITARVIWPKRCERCIKAKTG